jgi:sigma-54 dependent transcriptional regulator, acetoin dehydrogenase operon transcriptional activator AcoR
LEWILNRFPLVSMVKVNRARVEFLSRGEVTPGLVPDTIFHSWQRSAASGVIAESSGRSFPTLSDGELDPIREKNSGLLQHSIPVIEHLYEQIIHTSSMVVLADETGVILHSVGDPCFVGRARKVSLQPGGIWSEHVRGTNAIGTAIVSQSPIVVHNVEHFMSGNHFLTCSAAPIFDPHGRMAGILDVSGDGRAQQQQHTLALVRISAQQIENQMFSSGFEQDVMLHFHMRPEFIGTLYVGIAVFSQDGRFKAANRSALLHLGIDRYQAMDLLFSDLFDESFETILENAGPFHQPIRQIRTSNGYTVFCRAKCAVFCQSKCAALKSPGSPADTGQSIIRANGPPCAEPQQPRLEDLDLGDPVMGRIIAKARRVIGHDIPVLIEGESGTGKELFARALHNSGSRRMGQFVALNCAALPEGLIEAELFGYQEGAFTGAKKKGYTGKVRQADGGTLFLDEIGDMPQQLQARLLRVLQERIVHPLGGTDSYQVDFALVCATNRRIREEVTTGRFREDLYYRLNGLLITLPRLRDRADRLPLARSIVSSLAVPGRELRLSAEVVEIFENHPWPGNIRQMHNVLRTAVALLGPDEEITTEHLSEDFLEQYQQLYCMSGHSLALDSIASSAMESASLDHMEMAAIRRAMEECGGNVSAAARRLGISRNTLYRKWKEN